MSHPTREQLAAYWLDEGDDASTDAIEAHVFACAPCAVALERMAALIHVLADEIPPVISATTATRLEAQGQRIRRALVAPGETLHVVFDREVDLLLHVLTGDLGGATQVDVEIETTDGLVMGRVPAIPFDASAGQVLVACQRHYRDLPHHLRFRVIAQDGPTRRVVGEYLIEHEWV